MATISWIPVMDWMPWDMMNQSQYQHHSQQHTSFVHISSYFFTKRCSISKKTGTTVDGQNPAPQRMMIIPLFIGF